MKKGLIFLLLVLSFSVFGVGEVSAATDPVQSQNSPSGLTQADLSRWLGYSNAFSSYIDNQTYAESYKSRYDKLANYIFNTYKSNTTVTPFTAFTYILQGDPNPNSNIASIDYSLFTQGMNGFFSTNQSNEATIIKDLLQQDLTLESAFAIYQQNGDLAAYTNKINPTLNATQAGISAIETSQTSDTCSLSLWSSPVSGTNIGNCISEALTYLIKNTLITWAKILLYFSSQIMNEAIRFSIFDSSGSIYDILIKLYPIWQAIKQLIDYCVIFATLYIGAIYILNFETGKDFIKRHIPWLILFTLFVNFSYPATKAMIDVSNVISLKIYSSVVGPVTLEGGEGAAENIMRSLGIQGLTGKVTSTGGGTGSLDDLASVSSPIPALMAFFMIMYAAFIFAIIAALMIMRSIVLIFIVIASPLLLMNPIIPKLSEPASRMREEFFKMLALPIVFSLMLFLTVNVISGMKPAGGGGIISQMFSIILMSASLYLMFKVTKSFSGTFGKTVEGWAGTAAGFAGVGGAAMLAGGVGGGIARGTLGRLGGAMTNENTWIGEKIGKMRGTKGGELLHDFGSGLKNSNYDFRNTTSAQKLAGMGGVNIGKGSSNTFEKSMNDRREKLRKDVSSTRDFTAKQRLIDSVGKYNPLVREGERSSIQRDAILSKRKSFDKLNESEKNEVLGKEQLDAMKMNEGIDNKLNKNKETLNIKSEYLQTILSDEQRNNRRVEFDQYTDSIKEGIIASDHEKAANIDIHRTLKSLQNQPGNEEGGATSKIAQVAETGKITKGREASNDSGGGEGPVTTP